MKTLPCGQRDKHHAACGLIQTPTHRDVKNFAGGCLLGHLGKLFERNSCISFTTFSMYNRLNQLKKKFQTEQLSFILHLFSDKKGKNEKEEVKEV